MTLIGVLEQLLGFQRNEESIVTVPNFLLQEAVTRSCVAHLLLAPAVSGIATLLTVDYQVDQEP